MAISIPCSCGKTLKLKDDLAGRRIKCPACAGVISVPLPETEVVEPDVAEEPEEPAEDQDQDKPKKKKKKSKKKGKLALTEREKKDKEFERQTEKREMIRRLFEGVAYAVLGLIITIAAIYAIFAFQQDLLTSPHYGATVVIILGIGLGAIAKGVLGLLSVKFVVEEE